MLKIHYCRVKLKYILRLSHALNFILELKSVTLYLLLVTSITMHVRRRFHNVGVLRKNCKIVCVMHCSTSSRYLEKRFLLENVNTKARNSIAQGPRSNFEIGGGGHKTLFLTNSL